MGVGLQLEVGDVGPQWGDCSFLLKRSVAGGLEGTSDCAQAFLLDPFQWFPNPLTFCWLKGALQQGPDCCPVGEARAYHRTVDQPSPGKACPLCRATQRGEGAALLRRAVTGLPDMGAPVKL